VITEKRWERHWPHCCVWQSKNFANYYFFIIKWNKQIITTSIYNKYNSYGNWQISIVNQHISGPCALNTVWSTVWLANCHDLFTWLRWSWQRSLHPGKPTCNLMCMFPLPGTVRTWPLTKFLKRSHCQSYVTPKIHLADMCTPWAPCSFLLLYVCACVSADGHSSSGEPHRSRDLSLSLDAVDALQFLIVGSCDGNKLALL